MLGQQCRQPVDSSIPGRLGGVAAERAAAQPLVVIVVPATQADTLGAQYGAVTVR
ncbi:hypothetical protein D3C72_2416490 [compost metagenome]